MYSITGPGATCAFTVTGVAGATYSITVVGAAQDEDGATSSVTGEGVVKVTECAGAACSITGVALHRCPQKQVPRTRLLRRSQQVRVSRVRSYGDSGA